MRRLLGAMAGAVAVVLLTAAPAFAHGLVGKQDLPIPRWLFGWAAVVVLVISFVGLAVLWPQSKLNTTRERVVLRLPRILDPLCGVIGVTVFAGLVYAGLTGSQVATANVLPTAVYVIFWVGIPFASLAFGDVFRAFNPWRAVGRASGAVVRRIGGSAVPQVLTYPERLGHWPAAITILLFTALELAFSGRDSPSTLATLALVYAAVQFVAMSLYGVAAWTDRGDGFSVYFGLFASLSPLHWMRGALALRPPLSGTAVLEPAAGTVALLCVMIGSTSFDGFTASPIWSSIVQGLRPLILDAGLSAEVTLELVFALGLAAAIAIVSSLYLLGCAGMRSASVARREDTMVLARRFAPSLVPIALAYVIAHYFGLLTYQGQAMAYLISDPLGDGSNLLGTATASINYGWISATGIWYVQVAALVIGHACGLVIAHDRAVAEYSDPRAAARSQRWMLAVMITFTTLALWLLSNVD